MARIFRVVLSSVYQGQLVNLGMDYISAADLQAQPAIESIAESLGFTDAGGAMLSTFTPGSLAAALASFQNEAVSYTNLVIRAPYAPSALFDRPFPSGTTGQNTLAGGVAAPVFTAASFRSDRVRGDVRRGFKRVAGLYNNDIDDSGNLLGNATVPGNILATQFSATKVVTDGIETVSLIPSVLKTFPRPDTTPPIYELSPDELFERQSSAIGVNYVLQPQVTTQNSRKKGRGA